MSGGVINLNICFLNAIFIEIEKYRERVHYFCEIQDFGLFRLSLLSLNKTVYKRRSLPTRVFSPKHPMIRRGTL